MIKAVFIIALIQYNSFSYDYRWWYKWVEYVRKYCNGWCYWMCWLLCRMRLEHEGIELPLYSRAPRGEYVEAEQNRFALFELFSVEIEQFQLKQVKMPSMLQSELRIEYQTFNTVDPITSHNFSLPSSWVTALIVAIFCTRISGTIIRNIVWSFSIVSFTALIWMNFWPFYRINTRTTRSP